MLFQDPRPRGAARVVFENWLVLMKTARVGIIIRWTLYTLLLLRRGPRQWPCAPIRARSGRDGTADVGGSLSVSHATLTLLLPFSKFTFASTSTRTFQKLTVVRRRSPVGTHRSRHTRSSQTSQHCHQRCAVTFFNAATRFFDWLTRPTRVRCLCSGRSPIDQSILPSSTSHAPCRTRAVRNHPNRLRRPRRTFARRGHRCAAAPSPSRDLATCLPPRRLSNSQKCPRWTG